MDFVSCSYNFQWWVGLILSVNEPQLEVDVKFMCPQPHMVHQHHFISLSKICTVPYYQIICAIDSPSTSLSGRIY